MSLTKYCAYKHCRKLIPQTKGGPGLSLSRIDGRTRICSDCGMGEALVGKPLPHRFDPHFQLIARVKS